MSEHTQLTRSTAKATLPNRVHDSPSRSVNAAVVSQHSQDDI